MSLTAIFKKVPGGTAIGNQLRDLFHNVSPLLGNGAAIISQEQYDMENLSDELFAKKYGYTKNRVSTGQKPDKSIKTQEQIKLELANKQNDKGTVKTVLEFLKKYWYITLLPFGSIVLAIIWASSKKRR